MAECDICGQEESMPYHCRHCDGTYCGEHRLPENHNCPGLQQWEQEGAVFDSGFDDTVLDDEQDDEGLAGSLGIDTGPGGPLAYFRGNMTYLMLLLMAVTYLSQLVVLFTFGNSLHDTLFVFSPEHPLYVWTWVTSIFAHSPASFVHILFNGIVIYFFGRLVEQYIGSKEFAALFLASGILAGAGQVLYQIIIGSGGPGVVGASGAALALMGVLTVLKPDLTVYLYFIIPLQIWILTGGTIAISVLLVLTGGSGAGGIAHVAHLGGVLIGLAYGYHVKDRVRLPGQYRFGGGPGGPGGSRPPGPGRRP
ncbi:rhomboid family intramembrane serine protease [Halovenus rubra]|uniref:Rhomboid family intramembrane serine protease n=2 Tax=Halovenus rubra TaxID=869890 RepID=A0ABD5X591_9EURY|nr:rhomboid family intramembrane serine protease [Halovenus rubra]